VPQVATPRRDAASGETPFSLSPPLSFETRNGDSIRLARDLLVQAESVSDPTALIAATRLLLTPAEVPGSGVKARDGAG